ncbi:Co2+/Mg2+ efflux protein ApaG [Dickeya lacustris]|uniref:Protein ApaG n=1 Tax=Dickeya lacustris TaxID=2259638 RepID=A0ABY8G4G5_9GAMM|nr:Co2+/Mg2+ efflux protein ApaG [Dickeya lacustris]WFN54845.1 Co2+/Mg2+ efflux protein ApaG [Dickeya lacustris]
MMNAPRVCIQVQSFYVEAQSQPEEARFVFAYTITIRNLGRHDVKLLNRYWLITNGNGKQTEVQGEGVIGLQPVINPGSEFQYTSGAILETPMGTMEGYYQMIDHQGETFQAPISVFRLAIPSLIH